MKICIYLNNCGISNVDCSDLMQGNPGIGGTEYCILLLAQVYKKYYPESYVMLIVSEKGQLPEVDKIILCKDYLQVPPLAKEHGADILIVSSLYNGKPLPKVFLDQINQAKIKTISWGHNFYLSDYCSQLASCDYLKANVFVGRQQYDRYIDHKIIKKSTYIYNMYPLEGKPKRIQGSKPTVTYIGSLVPMKGFQELAAVWKSILAQIPDAQLNVIGSGELYSRNAKLGTYGIADEAFEQQIMPCLTDENGKILSSVHFLGVLGKEKNEVIANTTVGIVNPTGRTETFGISALDFESMGVPVVTIAKGGFLDTIIDGKTGILFRKRSAFVNAVISLLKDKNMNQKYGDAGIIFAQKFSPELIIPEWDSLFHNVLENKNLAYKKPTSFINSNLKWLRILNKAFHNPIAIISLESLARKFLRRLGR